MRIDARVSSLTLQKILAAQAQTSDTPGNRVLWNSEHKHGQVTALVTESLVVHLIHQMQARLGIMVMKLPSGHKIHNQSGSDDSGNGFTNHNVGIKQKMINEKEILSCSNIKKVIIRTYFTYFPASMRMLHVPEALG